MNCWLTFPGVARLSLWPRSAENLLLIATAFPGETLHRIAIDSLRTRSPDLALNTFERLAGVISAGRSFRYCRSAQTAVPVCHALRFITISGKSVLQDSRDHFIGSFLNNGIDLSRTADEMLQRPAFAGRSDDRFYRTVAGAALIQTSEILRIAARDLNGLAPLEEVTGELSDLASASLQVAYEVCRRCLVCEHGLPLMQDEYGCARGRDDRDRHGKARWPGTQLLLGHRHHLLLRVGQGETSGISNGVGSVKGAVSLHTFLRQTGRDDQQGHVPGDRGRLRLPGRHGAPAGRKAGDMAVSLRSAEIYYESWGQSWERAAMLKARPVAGSLELGEQFSRCWSRSSTGNISITT